MKVIGICGSPRKNGNSSEMLEHALAGAREQGAETQRVNLFDLQYSGCKSCFACKRLGGESFGRCALRDGLTDVLEKILTADAVVIATPLYFGEVPGAVRNLFERIWFPGLKYAKDFSTAFPKRVKVGLIYTMNVPDHRFYQSVIQSHKQNFMMLGNTEVVVAEDTKQFDDYSLYASELFDGAAKQQRRETVFPKECAAAWEMGKRLATK